MPARRFKTIVLLFVASVLILFYITTGASSTRSSEFYTRTVAAVNARTHNHGSTVGDSKSFQNIAAANAKVAKDKDSEMDGEIDRAVAGKEDAHDHKQQKQQPLADDEPRVGTQAAKNAAAKAQKALEDADEAIEKGAARAKAGAAKGAEKVKDTVAKSKEQAAALAKDVEADIKEAIDPVTGGEKKDGAGRKKFEAGEGKKVVKDGGDDNDGVAKVGNTGKKVKGEGKDDKDEEEDDHEVEAALDEILKRSPVIIFSKTYCPYSQKAKHILLDKYSIVPAPHVEELDINHLGARLQTALLKMTGRRTVPNILINGKSVGGGDDIAALDASDKLVEKIKEMGGKRIMEAKKVEQPAEKGAAAGGV